MLGENLKMAFLSIRGAKLRSFLTMLGIIIGVAAVVAIVAIGNGVKASVTQQVTNLGSNLVVVTSGKIIDTSKGGTGKLNASASLGTSTLTQKDVSSLSSVPGIKEVAQLSLISALVTHAKATDQSALVVATEPSYNDITNQKFAAGRFFDASEVNQDVVVLGASANQALFGTGSGLGQTVEIRGTTFKVVGVIKASDAGASSIGGPSLDDFIYLPIGSATRLTDGNLQILRIITQATSADEVIPAVGHVKQQMLKNHGGQEDFSVLTQKDLLSTISTVLNLLTTFIVAIASISLLVGGVGIMNIMLVSVTERTREIGIRKAIGASSRMVLTQFLIEAVVISLLGGVLGILVAIVQAKVGGHLAKITPVFTPGSIAIAFGVSVGVGIIFGLAPAIKAARMRPIQALRYE
jgi:putative ABC transport system permease protein